MLTNTIPAVVQALQKVLDPVTLKEFAQALGNCNQPLTHRGPVNIQNQHYYSRNGEYPGSTGYGEQWGPGGFTTVNYEFLNEGDQFFFPPFNPLFPPPATPNPIFPPYYPPGVPPIEVPGGGGGLPPIYNPIFPIEFFFPTFPPNFPPLIPPPTTIIGGPAIIPNPTITNPKIEDPIISGPRIIGPINGQPVQGPAGPPGQPGIGTPGRDGRDGAPGAPGMIVPFPAPPIFFMPPNTPPPPAPAVGTKDITYITELPDYDGKIPAITIEIPVKTYSFDAESCSLTSEDSTVTVEIPEQEVNVSPSGPPTYVTTTVSVPDNNN